MPYPINSDDSDDSDDRDKAVPKEHNCHVRLSPPRASIRCEEEVRSQRGGNELGNEHIYPDMRDAESSTREQ
ncbi:unnamed protein product [Penicillium camemberti]|uniref:Str. FM013 n=1 Tax=Penicillium camemberti (strain FM 013) TaxID=1429867 RepID=A0A0G4PQS0_PENC3|nr:unnamed protein product [Penicillium camemberti]